MKIKIKNTSSASSAVFVRCTDGGSALLNRCGRDGMRNLAAIDILLSSVAWEFKKHL